MDTWKLAHVHMQEAERIAQQQQLINQAVAANKLAKAKKGPNFLARIQGLKGLLFCYGESLYCRTLSFIYSRSG